MIGTIYNQSSGEIIRVASGPPAFINMQAAAGEAVIEGQGNDETQYVAGGQIVDRPQMPVAVNGTTLTAPIGASFNVTGPASASGVVDGSGEVEFVFSEPGEYTVRLRLFPYLPAEVVIHAG